MTLTSNSVEYRTDGASHADSAGQPAQSPTPGAPGHRMA